MSLLPWLYGLTNLSGKHMRRDFLAATHMFPLSVKSSFCQYLHWCKYVMLLVSLRVKSKGAGK